MTVGAVLGVCGAVLVATVVQQVSGFGFALLAVPLMSLVVGPRDAVAIAMAAGFFSSGLMAVGLRDRLDRPVLRRLLLGAAVGLPIGVVGLRELDEDLLRLALAVVVLAMVLVLASGFALRASNPRLEAGAGLVSGLLNGSLGTGGPPVIVVLHAAETEQHAFRATTSSFFAACDVVAIPLIAWSGAARPSAWVLALAAVPAVAVGDAVGRRLAHRLDQAQFRRLALVLLAATAVVSGAAALA
ncbi:MAG: sulfite exporter TauE/SafE family protein [Acidimicrobiales bacterium]